MSRCALLWGVAIAVAIALAIAGCGASSSSGATSTSKSSSSTIASAQSAGLVGGLVLNPPGAAPALALRNYDGTPVSLAALRGKAVFVTFVYTHCPNVCPLIVSGLAAASRALGPEAAKARFIAVTIDPKRDTPKVVKTFLTTRGALGRVDYLLGTRSELEPVWKAWHVTIELGSEKSLTHSAIVYGISGSGQLKIVYPSNFSPGQIVHDAPILARS